MPWGKAAITYIISTLATGPATPALCSHVSLILFPQGCNVMEDQDLREIGISDPQHRRKLLQAARSLPKVTIVVLIAACKAELLQHGKGAGWWR